MCSLKGANWIFKCYLLECYASLDKTIIFHRVFQIVFVWIRKSVDSYGIYLWFNELLAPSISQTFVSSRLIIECKISWSIAHLKHRAMVVRGVVKVASICVLYWSLGSHCGGMKALCQNDRCPERDSNRLSPKFSSRLSLFLHRAGCMRVSCEARVRVMCQTWNTARSAGN